jgi:DNA-3-methyladenine glycosylase
MPSVHFFMANKENIILGLIRSKVNQADDDRVLAAPFFDRPAEEVAHDLIGCHLHWKNGEQSDSRIITETEAYIGPDDLASHAARGRTKRNEAMFGPPASFYVYRCYGLHWLLNVVTGPVDYPAAVLLRSVEGIVGPARLTKAMGISGDLNEQPANELTGVWFSEGLKPTHLSVTRSARIGVDYAGEIWSKKPYRFNLEAVR